MSSSSVRREDAEGSSTGPTAAGQWENRWWAPILWVLWGVSVALVLFSFVFPFLLGVAFTDTSWIREFFDVSGERNLTAWWNSGLLLLAGVLSIAVGMARWVSRTDTGFALVSWWGLAALLGVMSLDEFAGVHEQLDVLWARLVGENPLPSYQWLMLGVPLAVAVLLFLWLCVRVLPQATARTYLLGMVVFFTGAIVVEALPLLLDIWRYTLAFHVTYHVEELLEFLGAALLVVAPLRALLPQIVESGTGRIAGSGTGRAILWEHAARQRRP